MGLCTSVSVNFNSSPTIGNNITSATTNSVAFNQATPSEALTIGSTNSNNTLVAQNGVLNNSQTTADTNLYLTIPGSSITDAAGTLNENSTHPQSVWYTMSLSGAVGADGSGPIMQAGYNLTQAEKDNIFAINANKIPSALNSGAGGAGKASESDPLVYTTAIGGTVSNNDSNSNGTAVAVPSRTLKTGEMLAKPASPSPKTTYH